MNIQIYTWRLLVSIRHSSYKSQLYFYNFLILLYKSLFFTHFPASMKNMLSLRSSSFDLRCKYIPSLTKPKTYIHGLAPFPSFQLNSGMHCLTFFELVFFADLKSKIQGVTFLCILFAFIYYLYLKLSVLVVCVDFN